MNDEVLRDLLQKLLLSDWAHTSFDDTVANVPVDVRGKRPAGMPHTPWQLLEHLRIAQSDILEFTRDGSHESPQFPQGYWPESESPPTATAWDESIAAYRADRDALAAIARDEHDLTAKIPHGSGQTILREILLAADHNAYHLGQLVFALRALGAWDK
jgi:uncharacterized damage-inducible protein DinB